MGGAQVDIWRAGLDLCPADLDALTAVLDGEELGRAAQIRTERERQHFVAARGLLRTLLGRYSGLDPETVAFVYNQYGKPAFAQNASLYFNLSDSHGAALFAFTRDAQVGVDLEQIRDSVAYEALAERFFTAGERAALEQLDPSRRREAFFTCWTRKEAYAKGLGETLAVALNRFDVTVDPREPARLIVDRGDPEAVRAWSLLDVDAGPGFRAAVAVKCPRAAIKVAKW
jgi:4'-phosphopantetheinyl transferase